MAGPDELATLSGDVAAMLATFAEPPVVAGASIGGIAAVHALADPAVQDRCAALVLVDVVPAASASAVREYLAPRGMAGHPLVAEVLDRAGELRAATRALRLPVRLVRGGAGSAVSDAMVAELAAAVVGLRVHVIAEAGHLVARDAPGELAGVLAGVRQLHH